MKKTMLKVKNHLILQILGTVLSFIGMGFLSVIFMWNITLDHLEEIADNSVSLIQDRIESDLFAGEMLISNVGKALETAMEAGATADAINSHLKSVSDNVRQYSGNIGSMTGFRGIYFYCEGMDGKPLLMTGNRPQGITEITDSDNIKQSIWYVEAVGKKGEIAEVKPYTDVLYPDRYILTYSLCLYGKDGEMLGVIGLDIFIDKFQEYVAQSSSDKGGVGVLLTPDLDIIMHESSDFVGKNLVTDNDITVAAFAEKLLGNENIRNIGDLSYVNYKGEPSVMFFHKLSNKWWFGLALPKGPYSGVLIEISLILSVFVLIFAGITVFILQRTNAKREKSDLESKHKSMFLANMSHEIRTPMNVIIGITQMLLQNKQLPPECTDSARKIHNACDSLLRIINDILDMSKIEAGKFELFPAEYYVPSMINDAVQMNVMRIGEKPIEFALEVDKTLPLKLFGDELRIKQILNNLLSNAIKYTDYGYVKLKIRHFYTENGDFMLNFTVSDTGRGIKSEDIKNLFSEYSRVNAYANRTTEGTGLGLNITKMLAEMMNGTVEVYSEYGKGSKFTVTVMQDQVAEEPEIEEQRETFRTNTAAGIRQRDEITDDFTDELTDENGANKTVPSGSSVDSAKHLRRGASKEKTQPKFKNSVLKSKNSGLESKNSGLKIGEEIAESLQNFTYTDSRYDEKPMNRRSMPYGKVLIVDDVETNLQVAEMMLSMYELQIETVLSGFDAIEKVKSGKVYDIIFMDHMMPEMDGIETTKILRQSGYGGTIVSLTANVLTGNDSMFMENGFDDFLPKPIDIRKLDIVVNKFIKNTDDTNRQ
ncbi:MAG: response regulator [Oscillospiraceae bacterium]|jgi:signal transduction histidine kinase/ActR/RegA family two-component response regulator|nr:response regulator [Oscillospiraceae bacterium]